MSLKHPTPSTLPDSTVEDLQRAVETLRDSARASFWSALDSTNADATAILRGAANTYAREANAVCAAMRVLGIRGVAPDFDAEEFARLQQAHTKRHRDASLTKE